MKDSAENPKYIKTVWEWGIPLKNEFGKLKRKMVVQIISILVIAIIIGFLLILHLLMGSCKLPLQMLLLPFVKMSCSLIIMLQVVPIMCYLDKINHFGLR